MHTAKEHVNLAIWIRVWHEEPVVSRDNSMDDDDDDDDDDDSGAVFEQLLFFWHFLGSIICSFDYVLMCDQTHGITVTGMYDLLINLP